MSDYLKPTITIKQLQDEPGAIALISDFKNNTDPEYVGPGTWNIIHRVAYKAQKHEQQLQFIILMKEICSGFPCDLCKDHCTEYIKNHPLEEYLDILVDINGEKLELGMFVWAWKFHNAVNIRIKKPIMSWDTAYNLYSQSESLICSKNCLAAGDTLPDGLEHSNSDVPILPEPIVRAASIPISQPSPFRMISVRKQKIS
ncbi:Erv1/Alr family protein [uncultured virus]|nr:Erv1/Alr family protein [uncultured virus]